MSLRSYEILHCDSVIDSQRLEIVVMDKRKKKTMIIDIVIPGDT